MDKSILLDFLAKEDKYPYLNTREKVLAYLADLEKPKEEEVVVDIAGNAMDASGNGGEAP